MARVADLVLLELEEKLLILVEQAWESYERSDGGMPPPILTNLLMKAHKTIAERLKHKLGGGFDPNRPEEALLEVERIRAILIRQVEQKHRLHGYS